ncbi:MAG: hypothetical protein WC332_00250 [Clostridia bacterium]|jgi:hypothetical protein
MFEFIDMMQFGKEIEAYGDKWVIVKPLQNRCHLAIRYTDKLPCQVYLIQTPDIPQKEYKKSE